MIKETQNVESEFEETIKWRGETEKSFDFVVVYSLHEKSSAEV